MLTYNEFVEEIANFYREPDIALSILRKHRKTLNMTNLRILFVSQKDIFEKKGSKPGETWELEYEIFELKKELHVEGGYKPSLEEIESGDFWNWYE